MRVRLTKLRASGYLLPEDKRQPLLGVMFDRRVRGTKVLEFEGSNTSPGQHQLYRPTLKKCKKWSSVVVYEGSAYEQGAWVSQEWEIDVAPVGLGWIKPERSNPSGARIR